MRERELVEHPMRRRGPGAAWWLWALVLLAGCEGFGSRALPPEPAPAPKTAVGEDALRTGMIGAETVVASVDAQPLRGFGLVVGLNGRGSRDCPSVIRDYLVDLLSKELGPSGQGARKQRPSASEMIDSLDTAVVEVTGRVPIGARQGARFDLEVRALPGTSTESLEGGMLLPTAMRFFDRAASGQGLVAGMILADGAGPVFVNPLPDAVDPTPDPRHGYVLGGGRSREERPIRLMLLRPNYQLAQTIQRRVNEAFGHRPAAAQAISAGYLELHTPPALARDPSRFRELVAHLYLDNQPALTAKRLADLNAAALAGADLERVTAAWEGLGRTIVADLQPLYTHQNAALRFAAARTGLRLGDLGALPVLAALAAPGGAELRSPAIRALGDCNSPQVGAHLAPLLNDADEGIRIAAYEALLQRGHPSIQSVTFRHILDQDQINFILDVVDSTGAPLIYVRRTRLPRIAVFGSRAPVTPPVFYVPADESVTIHTVDGADDLRVFAKRRGRMSEQIVLPPRVVDLITSLADLPVRDDANRLRGLGLHYSGVVRILAALNADQAISAPVIMEQFGGAPAPEVTPERPEGERPIGETVQNVRPANEPAASERAESEP